MCALFCNRSPHHHNHVKTNKEDVNLTEATPKLFLAAPNICIGVRFPQLINWPNITEGWKCITEFQV